MCFEFMHEAYSGCSLQFLFFVLIFSKLVFSCRAKQPMIGQPSLCFLELFFSYNAVNVVCCCLLRIVPPVSHFCGHALRELLSLPESGGFCADVKGSASGMQNGKPRLLCAFA
jgi:hypothetical protein